MVLCCQTIVNDYLFLLNFPANYFGSVKTHTLGEHQIVGAKPLG